MPENLNLLLIVVGLFLSVFGSVWSLAWWLSGQFTAIRNLVYTTAEKTRELLLSKLEYHEKHDDQRLAGLSNDIWDIRVRNARKDGLSPLVSRDKPND